MPPLGRPPVGPLHWAGALGVLLGAAALLGALGLPEAIVAYPCLDVPAHPIHSDLLIKAQLTVAAVLTVLVFPIVALVRRRPRLTAGSAVPGAVVGISYFVYVAAGHGDPGCGDTWRVGSGTVLSLFATLVIVVAALLCLIDPGRVTTRADPDTDPAP